MAETMVQYMSKTRADYGSGIARPKIEDKDSFELKCQFLKELRTNTFSGSDHEDANEHIEKDLEIVDLLHIPNITIDQVMLRAFPMFLTGAASRWLRNKPSGSITTWEDLKTNIQAQLNNLGREIKKSNEKVYAAQVGCEQCKGPYYTKDCPLKEERKTLEEAYYTQFGAPFQGGGYRVIALGFHQRNNVNPSYQERRQSMEETLSKFMTPSDIPSALDPRRRPFLSIAHAKIVVFKKDYFEKLNDLNVPLELRRDQVDDLIPTNEEGKVVEEFRARNDARMVFEFLHALFSPSYSTVLEDMDAYHDEGMGDVIFGEPFLREVRINAKRFEGMITIHNGNEEVTYQMTQSHPRTSLKEKEIDNVGGESMIWKSRSVGVLKPQDGCSTHPCS
ncbi:hypothetical protein Tco_0992658 [Tanacetum coccineum]|uniref:Retrotransposon gag domain-containing protein n=1 Tax=Tanacetum coccineum TaxID=301880 RepID=A0ABQ5F3U2_9ASTR